jgi:hypothetical protein
MREVVQEQERALGKEVCNRFERLRAIDLGSHTYTLVIRSGSLPWIYEMLEGLEGDQRK